VLLRTNLRIHPGIISQCDNLALMKMSSQSDLDELAKILGFAPSSLVSLSPQFRQGESLFAGGSRLSPELFECASG
jgi:hypothetical protein